MLKFDGTWFWGVLLTPAKLEARRGVLFTRHGQFMSEECYEMVNGLTQRYGGSQSPLRINNFSKAMCGFGDVCLPAAYTRLDEKRRQTGVGLYGWRDG